MGGMRHPVEPCLQELPRCLVSGGSLAAYTPSVVPLKASPVTCDHGPFKHVPPWLPCYRPRPAERRLDGTCPWVLAT